MRIEESDRLEGTGTLTNAAGETGEVDYTVVISQEVRDHRGSLGGRLPDKPGRKHITGTAILGAAIGVAMGDNVILELEDGRKLKVIFTTVGDPSTPAPFRASVVDPEQWA